MGKGCSSHFEKVPDCADCNRATETQQSVAAWCFETFPQYRGKQAISVLEEAVELAHESGCSSEEILDAVQLTLAKARRVLPIPELNKYIALEAADVLICLHALAEERNFDLQGAEDEKMEENRKKTPAEHNSKVRAIS